MRAKSIILLLLALGCGLVASIGISQVMESRKNQGGSGEMLPILVAVADINATDKFTPENVKVEEWPKDKVRNGALTRYEDLEGKHARSKIYGGEPVLAGMVIGDNERDSAPQFIPKGYVVCAVRVDAVSASGSLIRPGDRVNVLVYVTKNTNVGIKDTRTQTILQDISVFAVDTMYVGQQPGGAGEAPQAAKTVSLLVTLDQAEELTMASEMGTIRLVLRSAGDTAHVDTAGVTANKIFGGTESGSQDAEHIADSKKEEGTEALLQLLGQQKSEATPPPSPPSTTPGFKMTVLHGTSMRQIEFPADGSVPKELLDNGNSTSGDNSGSGSSVDPSAPTPPLPGLPLDPAGGAPRAGGDGPPAGT
jgi:pilus assembly protein CpaB